MNVCPRDPEEGIRFPRAEGIGCCELPSIGIGIRALWPSLTSAAELSVDTHWGLFLGMFLTRCQMPVTSSVFVCAYQ